MADIRSLVVSISHAGQDTCQRSCEITYRISGNRQLKARKPVWVTIGVQDYIVQLWFQAGEDHIKHRLATKIHQAFVAAAHSAGLAAGKYATKHLAALKGLLVSGHSAGTLPFRRAVSGSSSTSLADMSNTILS